MGRPYDRGTVGTRPCLQRAAATSLTTLASLLLQSSLGTGAQERRGPQRDRIMMGGMGGGGGGMGTLQALLTELSGLKKPRGFVNRVVRRILGMRPKPPPKYRILVMMATNMPQSLDEALLRPGRIDRIYKVGYPSKVGRIRTYDGYLAKVTHSLNEQEIDKLATITPYATGATIKDLVNESLINAIRDGRDSITWRDVGQGQAAEGRRVRRRTSSTSSASGMRLRSHEACHAVIAHPVRSATSRSTSPPSRKAAPISAWSRQYRRRISSRDGARSTRPTSW